MLLSRADSDKIIKPCLKTTCTHFNEITCTKVNSHQCRYKQSVRVFNPNNTIDIYFTRHNHCWLIYIPIIIHVAVDAYSEPLYKRVSRCISPNRLQDINALKTSFPENLFFFFFLNQGNLPKSTLSTLSMQQANLFTTNESFHKTYKTQSFSQHECSLTPQKLIDVHQNTNANTKTAA